MGHMPAYGNDELTERAVNRFREIFENPKLEVFFVFNGSASNTLGLKALTQSYESILCPSTAHIANDECGAPEFFLGSKLVLVDSPHGKLPVDKLDSYLARQGDTHAVQLRTVSISLTTEVGTLYSLSELKAIGDWCRKNKFHVHVDGARFSNAIAALGCQPKDIISALGVSVLSFGGTKNGLLGAEAIVFFNPTQAQNFQFIRKQSLQLASKMRFVAAQFLEFFTDDLWLENARHANAMAKHFEKKLLEINSKEIQVCHPVEANALFVKLPRKFISDLQKVAPFYVWNENENQVRWMCAFDTKKETVDEFVASVSEVLRT